MNFNENLRRLRKEKDFSQEFLAEKMNVTRQTISKWENGTAMPDLKKLTELAELFEVSMDDILGIAVNSDDADNTKENTEKADFKYIEALVEITEQNLIKTNQRQIRNISIFIVAVVVALIAILISFNNNLSAQINNLQNQINSLSNGVNIVNNDYDDDISYLSNYCTVEILKVYDDKPYIVQTQFKYEPESYSKNTKVYFTIPQSEEKIKKIETTEENGVFKAVEDIDLTASDSYCIIVEDGETINKEELDCSLLCEYRSFFRNEIECTYKNNSLHITSTDLEVSDGFADITSVKFVVDYNGKTIYNKPLKLIEKNNENNSMIYQPDDGEHIINNISDEFDLQRVEIYFIAEDSNGVVYKHYPFISNSDSVQWDCFTKICFTIDGKTVETEPYEAVY